MDYYIINYMYYYNIYLYYITNINIYELNFTNKNIELRNEITLKLSIETLRAIIIIITPN